MSSAIKIVAPPASTSNSTTTSPSTLAAQLPSKPAAPDKKLCRNIVIYGSCRFQHKGCAYSHDVPSESTSRPTTPAPQQATSNSSMTPLSAAKAAVFVPGLATTTSTPTTSPPMANAASNLAMGVGAQEFVPRREHTPALSEDAPFFTPSAAAARADAPGLAQSEASGVAQYSSGKETVNGTGDDQQALVDYYGQAMDLVSPPAGMYDPSHAYGGHQDPYFGAHQGGMGTFVRQPLQYHLYHPLPSTSSSHPTAHQAPSFFIPPSLHISLTQKTEAMHSTPSVDMKLPEEVGGYTGLMPLDKGQAHGPVMDGPSGFAGYRSWIYKAWKESDGRAYALRRIEGFRLQHEAAIAVVEKWSRTRHPGLVAVREAFTTRAFGDQSIVFVYDYHAASTTLYEAHLSPSSSLPPNPWSTPFGQGYNVHGYSGHQYPLHQPPAPPPPPLSMNPSAGGPYRARAPGGLASGPNSPLPGTPSAPGGVGPGVAERIVWSYIVQIGSVVKAVHNSGLAVRTLEPNRVLVTGKHRVRLAGCAVLDVLQWDGGAQIAGHQQDDLLSFGKLIIALACGSPGAVHNLPKSVDHIARMYSPDLKNIVLYLLSKPNPRKTIDEVLALMGARVLDELNASFVAEDTFEAELMRELENGRLVRLMAKFGFINERPEFDHDPRWAETGDRYIIKLFRDYVFHQVDENGRPVTDLSHVLTCLNKLDAGVDEKVMLISRDEQSCLIVSYREIKNCIEGAFLDLSR